MSLICIKSLRVRRGNFVLELPDWQIEAGTVWGVVGRNGAGKTTLLRALAGIDGVEAGQLDVFGLAPHRYPEQVREKLGFMADGMPLLRTRIARLLEILSGYYPTWDGGYVDELLARFGLDADARVADLSRGQGSKLRVVTAMAFHPRVLVLDEPSAGMDIGARRELHALLLETMQRPGRAIVISSHQLLDVQRICDGLLVLDQGRVRVKGAMDELVGERQSLEQLALTWGQQC